MPTMSSSTVTKACLVLFTVLLATTFASASEFHSKDVVELKSKDYDDKVSDGKVYFIKYYAPWCGHCKRLADTWKQLGTAFKNNKKVVIGHVDCTVDKSVCNTADIKGYPTLKVIYKGEEVKPYRGPRDLAALKSFVEETVKELTTDA